MPPRLLVGKDRLQLPDLSGKVGDGRLRPVDHCKPLMQMAQSVLGALARICHGKPELVPHAVKALIHGAHHVRLTGAEDLGHGLHPSGHLALRFQQL
jgi:hypothetical protein